jgi:hypothetical protein
MRALWIVHGYVDWYTDALCPVIQWVAADEDKAANIQGVSKRALQLWKSIQIYTEDIHVSNCHNVAKHTEFYLG